MKRLTVAITLCLALSPIFSLTTISAAQRRSRTDIKYSGRKHTCNYGGLYAGGPSPSISSISVPDTGSDQPGYLYTDDSGAIFIQWTQARRTVNGQVQLFRSLERERPARTEHGRLQ
jgi:hypothetical protein